MQIGAIILLVFLISFSFSKLIIILAPKLSLLDMPNDRSSHHKPIPRGGGLAFIISFFIGLILFYWLGIIEEALLMAFLGGGILIAFVGFIDDVNHVPAAIRILIHGLAAVWVLWVFRGMPPITFGFFTWHWHMFGIIIGIIGLTWLINLYNFMDGLDSLAASEAVFVSLAVFVLLMFHFQVLSLVALMLAISMIGFLYWNQPPAKLFMGDTGSGFLGYVFGVMMIVSVLAKQETFWVWIILLSSFWVDATATLIRRILQGEKWYEGHRTHAFQIAATKFNNHKTVVWCFTVVNICWLFPLALLAANYQRYGFELTLVAVVPLILLWHILNKRRELQNEAK